VFPYNVVSNKADIRKEGGIAALIKLLDSSDPDVKKSATSALCQLLDDRILPLFSR
jgi:HEAT repeat protein